MKFRCLAVTLLSAVATVASAADPQLLKLVMPDARVVSGIDVDRVKSAPFGQFFLSQLPADAGFDQFVAATGFDPRRDVHEVLMASPGDPQRKTGLLLVRGNFDAARVLALIQAAGKSTESYQGVTILLDSKHGGNVAHGTAFLDNTVVIAGDLDSVRAAIDRRTAAIGITPELASKIGQASSTQDAWLVSLVPVSAFAAVAPDRNVRGALQGDLLKSIQQGTGGVRFGAVIEVSGEITATTAQDATSLADVLKFFLNMAQTNAPAGAAQFVGLIKNLTVNTDANSVKLSVAIPETDLETLIKLGQSRATTGRRPRI